ncbi:hypothetical protein HKX48_004276 [Thoreauomyces humboldtii]|nr:hypothetical protein HKX48_004276 [Thoreauomyces humboldtii]
MDQGTGTIAAIAFAAAAGAALLVLAHERLILRRRILRKPPLAPRVLARYSPTLWTYTPYGSIVGSEPTMTIYQDPDTKNLWVHNPAADFRDHLEAMLGPVECIVLCGSIIPPLKEWATPGVKIACSSVKLKKQLAAIGIEDIRSPEELWPCSQEPTLPKQPYHEPVVIGSTGPLAETEKAAVTPLPSSILTEPIVVAVETTTETFCDMGGLDSSDDGDEEEDDLEDTLRCSDCAQRLPRYQFSGRQLRMQADRRKCLECVRDYERSQSWKGRKHDGDDPSNPSPYTEAESKAPLFKTWKNPGEEIFSGKRTDQQARIDDYVSRLESAHTVVVQEGLSWTDPVVILPEAVGIRTRKIVYHGRDQNSFFVIDMGSRALAVIYEGEEVPEEQPKKLGKVELIVSAKAVRVV